MPATPDIYNAVAFQYAIVTTSGPNVSGVGTIVCRAPIGTTSNGFPILINTSTPITVGGDSNIETVLPTAVSYDQFGNVNITATFANAHGVGEPVSSGSFGLQEAAAFATSRGGGLVALTPLWFGSYGSHAAGLTALVTFKSQSTAVTVLDYSGIPGVFSYAAAVGSVYASTTHVLY